MPSKISVLSFTGSLRVGSYNEALLRVAAETAPSELAVTIYDLANVPLYNADVEAAGAPSSVAHFKAAIDAADALLIATPEYNHGVPGILKNALDWASRPAGRSPLWQKPVGIIGASRGQTGTARAQSQLRQTFEFTNCFCMSQPELLVSRAHEKFDAVGRITDRALEKRMEEFLNALADWVRQFQTAKELRK